MLALCHEIACILVCFYNSLAGYFLRRGAITEAVNEKYSESSKSIDIISIGGLVPGLSREDIMNGISQPRNRNLAEMFHRLKYIESYGTGIRKILSLYSDSSVKPSITVTPNSFRISLPNRNSGNVVKAAVPKQYQAVIDYLNEHDSMTEDELQELLNIKRTRAYNLYKKMEAEGYIKVSGRGTRKIISLK